jgi:hypothetical protein
VVGYRTDYRLSPDGQPFGVVVPPVPRIQDLFLNSTLYLYASVEDAERGDASGGTAFITTVPGVEIPLFTYVVTAAHNIWRKDGSPGFPVLRINRRTGDFKTIPLRPEEWERHADADVAIAQLWLDPASLRVAHVPHELYVAREMFSLPESDDYNPEHLGIGDECYFYGRFAVHPGEQQNLPTVRFGHIAKTPIEPVGDQQESFLVEVRSFPGFSGSPVFVYRTGRISRETRYEPLDAPAQARLLGVDWCHLPYFAKLGQFENGEFRERANVWIEQSAGMMGVVPAWKVTEMLYHPARQQARQEQDEEAFRMKQERNMIGRQKPIPEKGG